MAEPILAIGKYEIAELVGSGGMASVYRGKVMGPMGFERLSPSKSCTMRLRKMMSW